MVKDLRDYGRVKRPQIGIGVRDYSQESGMVSNLGVYIAGVEKASPAEAGGLLEGDVIVKLGGREVNYSAQLYDALLEYYPGDTVDITVIRNSDTITVKVKLGEMR